MPLISPCIDASILNWLLNSQSCVENTALSGVGVGGRLAFMETGIPWHCIIKRSLWMAGNVYFDFWSVLLWQILRLFPYIYVSLIWTWWVLNLCRAQRSSFHRQIGLLLALSSFFFLVVLIVFPTLFMKLVGAFRYVFLFSVSMSKTRMIFFSTDF